MIQVVVSLIAAVGILAGVALGGLDAAP